MMGKSHPRIVKWKRTSNGTYGSEDGRFQLVRKAPSQWELWYGNPSSDTRIRANGLMLLTEAKQLAQKLRNAGTA